MGQINMWIIITTVVYVTVKVFIAIAMKTVIVIAIANGQWQWNEKRKSHVTLLNQKHDAGFSMNWYLGS